MANNYTQCCVLISDMTTREREYWIETERRLETDEEDDCPFTYSISHHGSQVVLYMEQHGDLEILANDIQEFLKRFRPDKRIGIEWAETCSRVRPGEFGGGAVLVTAHTQYWMSTQTALEEMEHRAKKEKVDATVDT